jgi:DNA polymerase III sliding clamp (beta) subunit (PCNA family)
MLFLFSLGPFTGVFTMLVHRSITAIGVACDPESTRYSLGGIHFERDAQGQPHAVATDGRRLIHATWPEPIADFPNTECGNPAPVADFAAIIPVDALTGVARKSKILAKVLRTRPALNHLVIDETTANGSVTIGATNGVDVVTERAGCIEGRFPKWRDVFPGTGRKTATIRLDARLLAEVCTALVTLCDSEDSHGVDVEIPLNGDGAVVLRSKHATNGVTAEALLMPLYRDR